MVSSSKSTGFSANVQNCKNRVGTNDRSTKLQKRSKSKLDQKISSAKGSRFENQKGHSIGSFQNSRHHKLSEKSSIQKIKLKIRPDNEHLKKDSNSGQEMSRNDDDDVEAMARSSENYQEEKKMENRTFSVPDPDCLMTYLYGPSKSPVFLSANHEFEKTPTGNKENSAYCRKRGKYGSGPIGGGGLVGKKKDGKKVKGLSGGFEGSEQCHNGKSNGKNKNEKFYNRFSNIGCLAYP